MNVRTEAKRRSFANVMSATDTANMGQLNYEANIRFANDTALQANINAEAAARLAADIAESNARIAADAAEANARMAADVAETNARIAADVNLQNQIAGIGAGLTNLTNEINRVEDYAAASTAAAMALGGTTFIPGKEVNLSMNLATYDGASAGSISVGAMVNSDIALHAGVASGFNKGGKTGARVGLTFGW